MNFNKNYILILILILGIGSGCKKSFLELVPKGKHIAEKTSDYYLLFNSVLTTAPTEYTLFMADDICQLQPFHNGNSEIIQRLYAFEDDLYNEETYPSMLTSWLETLYNINKIVNEVMDSEGGSLAEKESLRAEARVYRAWMHFYFVNLYGKPYHATTSATDPGFPLLTTSDLTKTDFNRVSVQEVYSFILTELNESIPLLPKTVINRSRISKIAAQTYLAKVHLYMGNYEAMLTPLSEVIIGAKTAAIPVHLYDYKIAMAAGGDYALGPYGPQTIDGANYKEGINVIQQSIGGNLIFFPPSYLIPKEVIDEFSASDFRRKFLVDRNFAAPIPFKNGIQRIYGRTKCYTLGANMPDVYLMLAEAKARTNDLTGAEADLLFFRKNRMSELDAAVSPNLIKEDLIKEIISERKKEFLGMGDRWFTIRRLSKDPIFPGIADVKHHVYNSDGSLEKTYSLTEKRLTLRLPLKLMVENPTMEQNP